MLKCCANVQTSYNICLHPNTSAFTSLLCLLQLQQVKAKTMLAHADEHLPRKHLTPNLPLGSAYQFPPGWSSTMCQEYITAASISSVWQCNSLYPAAMSAKLRQFTCSCSYTALGTSDLPSILCIHLISGTHSLTPADMCRDMQHTVRGKAQFVFLLLRAAARFPWFSLQPWGILKNNLKYLRVNQQYLIWNQICLDLSRECWSWTRKAFHFFFFFYFGREGGSSRWGLCNVQQVRIWHFWSTPCQLFAVCTQGQSPHRFSPNTRQ